MPGARGLAISWEALPSPWKSCKVLSLTIRESFLHESHPPIGTHSVHLSTVNQAPAVELRRSLPISVPLDYVSSFFCCSMGLRSLPSRSFFWIILLALAGLAAPPATAQRAVARLGATTTQHLTLAPGPNLVSLFVQPADANLETLFGDGLDDIVMVREASGLVFAPEYGLQTLTEWAPGQAYVVHARQEMDWEVSGQRIEPESKILLEEGWNEVAFFLDRPVPTDSALASIAESLSRIESVDGRVYPATEGRQLLGQLEPGIGYRVRVVRRDTLVYARPASQEPPTEEPPTEEPPTEEPPTDADVTVPTIRAAIALANPAPGQVIFVTDPVRGGYFRVTESGCLLDGGRCFVPLSASEATSVQAGNGGLALYDGPNDDGVDFESIQMIVGPGGDDVLPATALHGHGQHYGVDDPAYDFRDGSLNIKYLFREYVKEQTGRSDITVRYRYATSPLRLERVIEPLVLEGARTTDYVRPEWWGGAPYPENWRPDPSTPGRQENGDLDGPYDATDEIAHAMNVAAHSAAKTGRDHYVVLHGMYGYSRTIEGRAGVVLKGEVDELRSSPGDPYTIGARGIGTPTARRQGLRVVKGAPWRRWATDSATDRAYRQPQTAREALEQGLFTVIVQGREAALTRWVDLEVDGNLTENGYILSDEYKAASGPGGNPIWSNRVEETLQNTAHWNGFSAHTSSLRQAPEGSNMRLENVHVHSTGGNLTLSNDWVHFGGSRALLLGNSGRNHGMYGVHTAPGTFIDGIDVYGYYWKGFFAQTQGEYHGVRMRSIRRSPYTPATALDGYVGHRNDQEDPSVFGTSETGKFYFGETVSWDGVEIEVGEPGSELQRNGRGMFFYTSGPVSRRNISIVRHARAPAIVDIGSLHETGYPNHTDRSILTLDDWTFGEGIRFDAVSVSANDNFVRRWTLEDPSTSFVLNVRPGTQERRMNVVVQEVTRLDFVKLWAASGGTSAEEHGVDTYVVGAPGAKTVITGGQHSTHLSYNGFDMDDRAVRSSFRQFWRDVAFESWSADYLDLDHYERCTYRGRSSEGAGRITSAALATSPRGDRYVDVDPGLFYEPQDPSFVQVTGADAARFTGWSNVGSKSNPVLRLRFSGTSPVSFNWAAQIRPWPARVGVPTP